MSSQMFIGSDVKPVTSFFRLIGSDENALTHALAYLLANDERLMAEFLRSCKVRRSASGPYQIRVQERSQLGRTDITITGSGIRVVVEAKVGNSLPGSNQLSRYTVEDAATWESYDKKILVALTRDALPNHVVARAQPEIRDMGVNLVPLQWHAVFDLVRRRTRRLRDDGVGMRALQEFRRFFLEDYDMHFYDAEVLIRDEDHLNADIYRKGWMYVSQASEKCAPLYFAPYFTRSNKTQGLTHMSKVIRVVLDIEIQEQERDSVIHAVASPIESSEYPEVYRARWRDGIRRICSRAGIEKREGKKPWGRCNLYFLGKPIPVRVERPLLKPKHFDRIPVGYSLRVDEILTLPELRKTGSG